MMQPTKDNSNGKGKGNEKIHTAQFETVQQERQDNKSSKTYGSGVAFTERHETARKVNMIFFKANCILVLVHVQSMMIS